MDEIADLRAQLERITARLEELADAPDRGHPSEPSAIAAVDGGGVSRRQWVRGAAAAAIGGTAAVVAGARPVAANAGDPVLAGDENTTADPTRLDYTGSAGGVGTLLQSGDSFDGTTAAYPAAVGAWATTANQPNGLYGYSNQPPSDAIAAGVVGYSAVAGTGVFAKSSRGSGLVGEGGTYGVDARGDRAAIVVSPTDFRFPRQLTDFHRGGELYAREASDSGLAVELWFCTVGGDPGEWVQIAGPGQPGGFRAISPTRVYDSRVPAPQPGRISGGEDRTIDVAQARDLVTGAALGTLVPTSATALAFNVAVVSTARTGFLSVAPSYAAEFSAATINWSESGQILNNGSITALGNDAQVKVFAGGVGSTDFVIDVTGYWE